MSNWYDDDEDGTMVDLGGGMVVPLSELLEDEMPVDEHIDWIRLGGVDRP